MTGAKIPILEIEKLSITDDGRGFYFYDDGTNFRRGSCKLSTSGAPSGGSNAWLKIHMVSSSTYGATGSTYYIPCYEKRI